MALTVEDRSEVRSIAREETKLAMKVDETNQLVTRLIESSRIAHAKIEAIEADVAGIKGDVAELKSTQTEHGKMLESHGKMLEAIMRHMGIELDE